MKVDILNIGDLQDNDVIVLYYDCNEISIDEAYSTYKSVDVQFPNKVIGVPKGIIITKENRKRMLEYFENEISKLKEGVLL